MKRVWILAGALFVVAILELILVGFVGSATIKTSLPVIAFAAGAVLLPGGSVWWKGLFLFVGSLAGMVGFLLGAGLLPDNNVGYFLGVVIPVLIMAIIAMWTKSVTYLMCGVFGAAAFSSVYTTYFFSDPQSINFSMPVAFGIMLVPMALSFLVVMLVMELVPGMSADSVAAAPPPETPPPTEVDDSPAPEAAADDAGDSKAEGASDSAAADAESDDVTKVGA